MFWNNVKAFWSEPYKGASEMSVPDWFLLVGLILVLIVVWNLIFWHIAEGLKA